MAMRLYNFYNPNNNPIETLRHRSDTTPTFILQARDCFKRNSCRGYKALEFLGLRQGIESNDSIALSSSPREVEVNFTITDYCMSGMAGCDLLKKVKVFVMIHLRL
ncbi:hypothetical protein YC2023_078283 [Brassica napus]|uniref:(rape) hypothetical protein n=1 Tax=Brassica napus TaxID=3708 RepID=A0A816QGG7_BRANA|nr:unnamed protein product [Brassica napus]